MFVSWKRLLITLSMIIVASGTLGTLMWSQMNKIVASQNETISNLRNKSSEISNQYLVKLKEKNEKAAETPITNSNTNSSRTRTTNSEQESSTPQEEPTPQSQILYFYNPSCGACIAQEPIVLELQSEGIPFVWCNIIENPSYISQYSITATPTFILNGNRRNYSTKTQLQNFWNTYK